MRDILELAGILLVALLIIIAFFAVISVLVLGLASVGCDRLADVNPDLEFNYSMWTGCLVKTPAGLWIDSTNMHLIEGLEQ